MTPRKISKERAEINAETDALRKKAYRGDAEAMYLLACGAYNKSVVPRVFRHNLRWAIYWAGKADRAGYVWAATLLGHLYSNAENPGFDLEKALTYYRRDVARGSVYAKECVEKTLKKLKRKRKGKKLSKE